MPAMIALVMKLVLGVALGTALVYASKQDMETRTLSLPMAWAFVLITALSFAARGLFLMLGLYVFFLIFSYFLYEQRMLQIGAGLAYVAAGLFFPDWFGSMEQASTVIVVGLFWALAFLNTQRGESDYNVLFTALAYLGVSGFMIASGVILVLFLGLTLYETFLHARGQTFTHLFYQIYFRLAGITKEQPIEVIYKGKRERLPVIPLLHLALIPAMLLTGFFLKEWVYLVAGGYSLLALAVGLAAAVKEG